MHTPGVGALTAMEQTPLATERYLDAVARMEAAGRHGPVGSIFKEMDDAWAAMTDKEKHIYIEARYGKHAPGN